MKNNQVLCILRSSNCLLFSGRKIAKDNCNWILREVFTLLCFSMYVLLNYIISSQNLSHCTYFVKTLHVLSLCIIKSSTVDQHFGVEIVEPYQQNNYMKPLPLLHQTYRNFSIIPLSLIALLCRVFCVRAQEIKIEIKQYTEHKIAKQLTSCNWKQCYTFKNLFETFVLNGGERQITTMLLPEMNHRNFCSPEWVLCSK